MESGIYTISPDGQQEFDVYCDPRTQGGRWTVFQKRFDGTVDFFEDWKNYTDRFGSLENEFWLGFNKIYRLTSGIRNVLRIDLGDFKNASSYAEYDLFKVLNEDNSYELQLGNFTGTKWFPLLVWAGGERKAKVRSLLIKRSCLALARKNPGPIAQGK